MCTRLRRNLENSLLENEVLIKAITPSLADLERNVPRLEAEKGLLIMSNEGLISCHC